MDKESLRYIYTKEQIESLPVVVVVDYSYNGILYKAKCELDYNPIGEYQDLIKPLKGEIGCNSSCRFVEDMADG